MKVIQVSRFGSAEVLHLADMPAPQLEAGEVLIELRSVGVNRADILLRSGNYHASPPFPFVPGFEGSGIVREADPKAGGFQPGDRVLAMAGRPGFYAEYVAAPAAKVFRIPDRLGWGEAAALPTAWLTAWYCLSELARLRAGETILVRGAASGVGDAAVQLATYLGARVIAAAGSDDKAGWARTQGAEWALNYERQDVVEQVGLITDGRGVEVVLDAVGGKDFVNSLKAVGHFGRVVAMANVTLEPSVVNTRDFYPKNARIYGFQLGNLIARGGYNPGEHLGYLMRLVADGKVQVHVDRTFPLAEAAAAHRYLEARQNRGKVTLIPA